MKAPQTKEVNISAPPSTRELAMFQPQAARQAYSPQAPQVIQSKGDFARQYNFQDRNNALSEARAEARNIRQEGRLEESQIRQEGRLSQAEIEKELRTEEAKIRTEQRAEDRDIEKANQDELAEIAKEKRTATSEKTKSERELANAKELRKEIRLEEEKLLEYKENLASVQNANKRAELEHKIKLKETALSIQKQVLDAKLTLSEGDAQVQNYKYYTAMSKTIQDMEDSYPIDLIQSALGNMEDEDDLLDVLEEGGYKGKQLGEVVRELSRDKNKAEAFLAYIRGHEFSSSQVVMAENKMAPMKNKLMEAKIELLQMRNKKMTPEAHEVLQDAVRDFVSEAGKIDISTALAPSPPATRPQGAPTGPPPSTSPNNPVRPISAPTQPNPPSVPTSPPTGNAVLSPLPQSRKAPPPSANPVLPPTNTAPDQNQTIYRFDSNGNLIP